MDFSKLGEIFKKYDFSFFGMGLAIFIIGAINLYSATHSSSSVGLSNLYKVQIAWYVISLLVGVVISFISSKTIFRFSFAAYFFNIFLLVLVLILGQKGMGAQRWLVIGPFRIQPSELMKITVIFALARWLIRLPPETELKLKNLIIPALLAFIPAILIMAEPDLGTGLLVLLIFFSICFFRKIH